jgi:hypothetical protein
MSAIKFSQIKKIIVFILFLTFAVKNAKAQLPPGTVTDRTSYSFNGLQNNLLPFRIPFKPVFTGIGWMTIYQKRVW